MSWLQFTRRAENDLDRLTDFLLDQSQTVAQSTTELVIDGLQILRQHPRIGRVRSDGLRELVISRGKTGYIALTPFTVTTKSVMSHGYWPFGISAN